MDPACNPELAMTMTNSIARTIQLGRFGLLKTISNSESCSESVFRVNASDGSVFHFRGYVNKCKGKCDPALVVA